MKVVGIAKKSEIPTTLNFYKMLFQEKISINHLLLSILMLYQLNDGFYA